VNRNIIFLQKTRIRNPATQSNNTEDLKIKMLAVKCTYFRMLITCVLSVQKGIISKLQLLICFVFVLVLQPFFHLVAKFKTLFNDVCYEKFCSHNTKTELLNMFLFEVTLFWVLTLCMILHEHRIYVGTCPVCY
jgi:hypothetical protein